MPYYIHHRNGQPISLNSFRLRETDIEISDEMGERFISTEQMLSDFKIDGNKVIDATDLVKLGDREVRTLQYISIIPTELSLIISPNPSSGSIDFFTKTEVTDIVTQSEFVFVVDWKEYVIDFADFIEGQYSLYAPFTDKSTYAIEGVVENIYLYKGYGDHFHRQRNRVKSLLRNPAGGLSINIDEGNAIYVTDVHNPNNIRRVIVPGQPVTLGGGEVGYFNGVRLREI